MRPFRSLRPLVCLIVAVTVAAPTPAQQPGSDSPRLRAIRELASMLEAGDGEALGRFVEERATPAFAGDDEAVGQLFDALAALEGGRMAAAMPGGPGGATIRFERAGGGSLSVAFEAEAEPPHRFTHIDVYGLETTPLQDHELARALTERVARLAAQDRFSGTVLVARGETPLVRVAHGAASRRFGVPNRPDTKINLGSMNKMFTGVAICQLVEEGVLEFDDTVGEQLPDYPNREVAEKVTIHHLLTHTSGLGSYWNEKWEQRWTSLREVADLLPLFVNDPLAFEPGERFRYSNAGPIVLGLVLEAVTGQSYYDYVQERVHTAAGMPNTACYEMDVPVPNLAIGYTRPDGSNTWRNNMFQHSVRGGPAGGGFSTADDLLRFARAVTDHRLLRPEATARMLESKVSMGPGMGYGYLFGDRGGKYRSHGHNGGGPGINAELAFYPELDVTLVVLSNYGGGATPVVAYARSLVERLEPDAPVPPTLADCVEGHRERVGGSVTFDREVQQRLLAHAGAPVDWEVLSDTEADTRLGQLLATADLRVRELPGDARVRVLEADDRL